MSLLHKRVAGSDAPDSPSPKRVCTPSTNGSANGSVESTPPRRSLGSKRQRQNILHSHPSATAATAASAMSGKPVKLQIKNFRSTPSLPADFEDKAWAKLRAAIQAIYAAQPVADNLEALYRTTEQLCSHKLDARLYDRLKGECEAHARTTLEALLSSGDGQDAFLGCMKRTWDDYCEQQKFIRSIFLYLDRTYVLQNKQAQSIWEMGLHFFGSIVLANESVRARLLRALLGCIADERGGTMVDRLLLRGLLQMLRILDLYEEVFEREFLETSRDFYRRESFANIHVQESSEYLSYCTRRLDEEKERVSMYLGSGTEKPLIDLAEAELIGQHAETIVGGGFTEMMDEERLEYLEVMHSLLGRVAKLELLALRWREYITKKGNTIMTKADGDATMVEDVLGLKRRCTAVLTSSFRDDAAFRDAMNAAFETFMNVKASKPPELLAKYVDRQLRSGNRSCTEDELDALLSDVMALFRFVKGKDIFQAFFRKDLAKRLLLGKSASIDMERVMIQKLKEECGPQFTSKFEGMFKDVDISKELMVSFKNSKAANAIPADVDFTLNVLTTTFWPPYAPATVKLPIDMTFYQEVFKEYYLDKHQGRQLSFLHALGHCVLKANYPKGKRELCVSLFQAVVLLLFNDHDKMVYADIRDATGIDDKELRRTLQSLACGKLNKLLLKAPKGREVKDTDTFVMNGGYTSKLFRVKVNSIQSKETAEEQKKTHEDVRHDRQYQIDAAIVRIMKARKSLKHALLMAELFSILKFSVETSVAKKRIESLIEREYLERDAKDRTVYHYLA